MTKTILNIISAVLSLAAAILLILQLMGKIPDGNNLYLLCLGITNLCSAFNNWKRSRVIAYISLGAGIFIIGCFIVTLII